MYIWCRDLLLSNHDKSESISITNSENLDLALVKFFSELPTMYSLFHENISNNSLWKHLEIPWTLLSNFW